MNNLTHEIVFRPAWDKRNVDPEHDYGIHCVDMSWYVKGPEGAVQFVVYTGWYLPENRAQTERSRSAFPMAADLGYHSPKPHYEGHDTITEDCSIIGGPCYYDSSGLNAEPVLDLLIREGSQAVWDYLDKYYLEVFGLEPQPQT